MSLDPSVRSDSKLTFAATLPLKSLPRFSCDELLAAVLEGLDGTGASVVMDPELTTLDPPDEDNRMWNRPQVPPRVGLIVNGVTMLIEGHDRAGLSTAELALLDVRSWPGVRARISRALAHVEITEVQAVTGSDLDHNYDRAAAVTVVAAAAAKLTNAVAVVWRPSRCAVPREQLRSLVSDLMEGRAPLPLWLGRMERPAESEDATGAATRGFYPLLGAELEVASQRLSQDTAFKIAQELAIEILRSGEPPAHDAWLDYDSNTEFSVSHRANGHGDGVPVVVLTHAVKSDEPDVTAGVA